MTFSCRSCCALLDAGPDRCLAPQRAALFGLAHWTGGWSYVLLAALAGLGYALAFRASGRIEMAILAHFGLNAMHFLLLTYPRLAGVKSM